MFNKIWKLSALFVLLIFINSAAIFAENATNKNKQKNIKKSTNAKTNTYWNKTAKEMAKLGQDRKKGSATVDTGGLGTFVETILILTLFIVGIYGIFRFIQKKKGTTVSGESTIKILSSLSLGGSRMLQIVEVGSKVYFIGVADSSINLISEIDDKETIDWVRMEYSKGNTGSSEGFIEKLFLVLGKGTDDKSNKLNRLKGDKIDFLKKQKDRLKKLK